VTGLALCLALAGMAQVADHKAWQQRPIQLGTSGGSINDRSTVYCCGGTLGSLLTVGGKGYILSNNHVLARTNQAPIGEDIIQPGLIDQTPVCYQDPTDVVADLTQFIPISFKKGTTNKVDAAIALPRAGAVNSSGSILEIGPPSSTVLEPSIGLGVKKSGRTTAVTSGTVHSVGVTIDVQYQLGCGTGKKVVARFVDQFSVTPSGFSAGGDSGSLIVENVSTSPGRVGLLFAGSSTLTFANKMSNVVAAFGASAASTASSSEPAPGRGRPSFPDQRVEQALRIKDRYDEFLFSLPDVVGHGVGISQTRAGEPVIQLYVRHASEQARRAAPPFLEGIPVEILETGEIYALPGVCGACGAALRKPCK
jgi:hypothetical protein